jgi:5-methyltetrahydrofolate--homocysteine methyltransferase
LDLKEISNAVIKGDQNSAKDLTQKAIDEGISPQKVINEGLCAGMEVVGEKFRCNEYYVPQVLLAARAMKTAMEILKPLIKNEDMKYLGKVVIGTAKGDLHDIGKNLVAMMLEGAGFEVFDVGADTPPEKYVEEAKERGADIICISALMTTTMSAMKDTVQAFSEAGMKDRVRIMIGGAPVTQAFADEIGAQGYGDNASEAVETAKKLIAS